MTGQGALRDLKIQMHARRISLVIVKSKRFVINLIFWQFPFQQLANSLLSGNSAKICIDFTNL